jgi:hypothetical protein
MTVRTRHDRIAIRSPVLLFNKNVSRGGGHPNHPDPAWLIALYSTPR